MQKQTIFEIPLYVCEVENHQDQKQKLITYIDEYFEKDIQTINLENTAEVTEKNLHVSNWFDDLVKYIGSQCPQLHGDFGISLNRSLGVSGMWATRCQRGFRIDQEVFANYFLYGAYFLQTPPNSGNLSVLNLTTDRDYFSKIAPTKVNTVNTNVFETAVPEGSMLLFPSHLIPKYSTNASDDPRYIVHFLIDIVE
jgi:uncharacterized protein (TIGR02466 family)